MDHPEPRLRSAGAGPSVRKRRNVMAKAGKAAKKPAKKMACKKGPCKK